MQEADLGRHVAGERHLVGGQHHRGAVERQLPHDVEHLARELGVEGRGHLVEQEQGRVGGHGPRHRDALLLAARQPVGVLVHLVGQAEPGQQLAGLGLGRRLVDPVHLAGRQGQVLQHGQVREQVVGLEDDAHPATHGPGVDPRVGDVLALEEDRAVVDVLEQVEAAQQRGLPRPRRPDQADHVVRLDDQVDAPQHDLVAVGLPQLLRAEHRLAHRAPARSRRIIRRPIQSVNRASGIVSPTNSTATTTIGV